MTSLPGIALARVPRRTGFVDASLAGLGPAESAYPARIGHARRRREWLAGRMLAKILLEGRAAPGPDEEEWFGPGIGRWEIVPDASGAPRVLRDGEPCPRRVSISHSGGWVLAAVSEGGPLGVDVEAVASGAEILVGAADPGAAAWLAEAAEVDRPFLGTLLWTLKEAVAKTGLLGRADAAGLAALPVRPRIPAPEVMRAIREGPGWNPVPVDAGTGPALLAHVRAAGAHAAASLVRPPFPPSPVANGTYPC